jgi:3-oxoacyl-[acyl-carrier protein] reductase
METGLKGRAALVGGASRGLGRAAAEALAAEGCRLMLWSRGGDALDQTAQAIREAHGVEVHTVGADAADPEAPEAVALAAQAALGRIDVLVLNAGGPPPVDPTNTDAEGWRHALQLLAITPIQLATGLLPSMREAKWGRIVTILSSTIRQPIPNLVYSTGGRSALAAWLKTTALAVARDGVTINGVLPGRLDTARVAELDRDRAEREGRPLEEVRAAAEASIPIGRYGSPDELGSIVAFLCSERAGYVTGSFIPVDGGLIQGL